MTYTSPDFERAEARGRNRRQLIGFGSLLLLVLLLATLVVSTMHQAKLRQVAERQHLRIQEMLLASSQLQLSIHAAGRSARGFMLTNDPRLLEPFKRERISARQLVERLRLLAAGDPARIRQVQAIGSELESVYLAGERLLAMQENGQRGPAIDALRSGRTEQRMTSLLGHIDRLSQAEIAEQRRHASAASAADRRQEVLTYSMTALALLFLGIAAKMGIDSTRAHIRSVALSARLHHLATRDELTDLYSRRSFFEILQRERDLAARNRRSLAVAIVDVDHFKRINDTHGHQAGDAVLVHVARLLTGTLRSTDIVGRIGGEEFAVIMPETDVPEARAACERLRKAIARSSAPLANGVDAMITISTGIALLGAGEDRDALMGRADHALYAAKSGGRNQVRLAA